MTVGRIFIFVFASMLAGVMIGMLGNLPPGEPALENVAGPRVPSVATVSVRQAPSSAAPVPSSSSPSPAPPSTPTPVARVKPRPGPELPPGQAVRAEGEGWWRTVAGTTAQVGGGRVHTYSVEVEQGAVLPAEQRRFAEVVDRTLADPRGWTASGDLGFRRVDVEEPDVRIRLTATGTARSICGFQLPYDTSCYAGGVVYVSAPRWFRGAESFAGDLAGYRQYVVNHEIGHFLGRGHEPCPADGAPAPVMMQQTFSVSNDRLAEITAATPQGVHVPRDGNTCVPNPWPTAAVTR
ncbi:hypothetical protein GCM10011609_32670 [Lentzea pudingi]|uniref:DUF3152 domain-containing protein n=1 Tax=Lentzea pudingi TaxID=1789439 RepID=A0ABQ2HYQ5_9PSEU|nr:DUF3152 domain-containing protein [Lentzea pudingi]GGM92697.1 hypothetical protein GCM10011609_32670 [Lentzea pudingi]